MLRELVIEKSIPREQSNLTEIYLKEISKIDKISMEEEIELACLIKEGDISAFKKLTSANLRFVFAVTKQFQNRGLSLPELINEGNLGLMKAAEKFDGTHGFKFISYAIWDIRHQIMEAIALNKNIVPATTGYRKIKAKIDKVQRLYFNKEGNPPTLEYISMKTEESINVIKETLNFYPGKDMSLDSSFSEDNKNCLIDVIEDENSISPDKNLLKQSIKKEVMDLLKTLKSQEYKVLSMFFGFGCEAMTTAEIAKHLNLEEYWIKRIKKKALDSIKNDPEKMKKLKSCYA